MKRLVAYVLVIPILVMGSSTIGHADAVPPPAPNPNKAVSIVAKDGLISLTFKDTEVRDILTGISLRTGVSIVADTTVQGRVTFLSLRNVPLEEAIRHVASAGGAQYVRTGNVYTIGRNLNLKPVTASYRDEKLTLDATRADVKDLLQAVGQASGLNFIPAQELQKNITVSLKEVPLETSLRALLEANGMMLEKKNEQLYIVEAIKPAPPEPRPAVPPITSNPRTAPQSPTSTVTPPPPASTPRSETVTLTLENAPLSEILKRIGEQTGATLVFTGEIDDKIKRSIRLTEVSVQDALAAILAGTKYAFIRLDTVRSTKTEASGIEKSDQSAVPKESNGEKGGVRNGAEAAKDDKPTPPRFLIGEISKPDSPEAAPFLFTEVVPLRHLRVTDVSTFLSVRVPKDAVKPIKDQNAVSLTGTQEQIARIKDELRSLDKPAPQIMLQAVVVETTLNSAKDLGLEYAAQDNKIQAIGPTGSSLVFRTTGGFGKQFTATLTALITQGKARIVANPRVATINGKQASIDITDTRYFRTAGFPGQQVGGSGASTGGANSTNVISPFAFGSIQSIDAGIKLQITPWVGADGDIQVDVTPEVSSVVGTGPEGLPELSRRVATTTIRVKTGETIMIGGLRQREESKSVTKPFLIGDIPLIGNLFRHTVKNKRESELMILITPRLIEPLRAEEAEKVAPELKK